jgi:hypothetical protein
LKNSIARGNGSVAGDTFSFAVTGSNRGNWDYGENLTSYTLTLSSAATLHFNWTYSTQDILGPQWDPAGWLLNGVEHQLTQNDVYTAQAGTLDISLKSGDIFGWYVDSMDQGYGAGTLRVNLGTSVSEPPISWAMLAGLAALAFRARRHARSTRYAL